jgi:hypothetical protein
MGILAEAKGTDHSGRAGPLLSLRAGVGRQNALVLLPRATSIEAVMALHARGVENGVTDDGLPGPREGATVTYYGAFIRDLDGHKVEVMTVPRSG